MSCSVKRMYAGASVSSGFTLLELLVVIGIMAVLAGGFGLYRMNQNASGRMDAAARTVSAVCSRARLKALMTHEPVRLLVNVDPSSRGFLRSLFVCGYRDGDWTVRGGSVLLPSGVGVMPGDPALLEGDWTGELSVFSDAGSIFLTDPDGRGERVFKYIQFSPDGSTDSFSESDYLQSDIDVGVYVLRLCISTFNRRGDNGLVFDNPNLKLAVMISPSGDHVIVSNP